MIEGYALRYEAEGKGKSFRQVRREGAQWYCQGLTSAPLYRLPELLASDLDALVFVVEGEKDVDRLVDAGLTATTTIGGAGKWRKTDLKPLCGRAVVLLPDNDDAGRKHVDGLAKCLRGLGVSPRILQLPGLNTKGDVSDWLDAGGRPGQLVDLARSCETQAQPSREDTAVGSSERAFPLTDIGNGERLVEQFGDRVRYVAAQKRWLVWDGRRWRVDDSALVEDYAKQMVRGIYAEAAALESDFERRRTSDWAQRSEHRARLTAALEMARSDRALAVRPSELDADGMLLNVQNGTLDLRTGKLREHNPDDLITQFAPVDFDTGAPAPRFIAFLNQIMGGDESLVTYLQRLSGICLTGDISEQILPILHGEGANGKSVFVDLMAFILGDYAAFAPESLVTTGAYSEHPTELASLQGKRLVVATETEEGRRMRVALVKKLTGDARLSARVMRGDYFQFDRTHKLLIVSNHKPSVSETKHAIWRRLHLVPFSVTIEKANQDPRLLDKLKAEASGVLAWMVRGCLAWQRDGLSVPPAVASATQIYRDESDPIADFLSECCYLGNPDSRVTRKDISEAYASFMKALGDRNLLQPAQLYARLGEREEIHAVWVTSNGKRVRGFSGVSILATSPLGAPP